MVGVTANEVMASSAKEVLPEATKIEARLERIICQFQTSEVVARELNV